MTLERINQRSRAATAQRELERAVAERDSAAITSARREFEAAQRQLRLLSAHPHG